MFTRRLTTTLACLLAPLAAATKTAPAASVVFEVSAGGNGHEYEVVIDAGADQAAAEAAAAAAGGHLISITSPAEQAFIESVLFHTNSPTGGYWMGLERVGTGGSGVADDFRWSTGESLTFENFAGGEPNAYLNMEDAGQIYWSADMVDDVNQRRGGWNDVPPQGYQNTPVSDLVTAGFIIERTEVGDDGSPPVAIPVPPAILAAPAALALCGVFAKRMRPRGV